MICFAIALRSKKSTKNWENVVKNFNNTLQSIFNQTNSEFEVYVGCNEIPELFMEYDERLHFITTDLPTPKSWEEGCRDRSWKLLLCAKEIRNNYEKLSPNDTGVFVFPVDADDYINCKIAEYCVKHANANGFKSKNGYKWIKGKRYATITKYYGGSMNIMKMYKNDLPEILPNQELCFDKETAMELTRKYPIRWYDIDVEGKFASLGKPLSRLPFRSTIYVLGTGDNISEKDPQNKKDVEFHPIAMLRSINPFDKRRVSKKMKEEFGILE